MIDLDSHLMEPRDYLVRHAPAALQNRLMMHEAPVDEDPQWSAPGAFDRSERARWLGERGIVSQLVLPGFSHVAFAGTDLALDAARAQHRAAMEWADGDERFNVGLCVPTDEPDSAAQLMLAAADAGAKAVLLIAGRRTPPSHVDLDPVWAALAETGLVGVLHFGTTWDTLPARWRITPERAGGEAADPIDVVCAHHAVEAMIARLALSGVFNDRPALRLLTAEHGSSWLPGFLTSLDVCQRAYRKLDPGIPQGEPLSVQVRRALTVTPFVFEPIGQLIDLVGDDILAFATDHPHPEGGADPAGRFERSLENRPADQFFTGNATTLLA